MWSKGRSLWLDTGSYNTADVSQILLCDDISLQQLIKNYKKVADFYFQHVVYYMIMLQLWAEGVKQQSKWCRDFRHF